MGIGAGLRTIRRLKVPAPSTKPPFLWGSFIPYNVPVYPALSVHQTSKGVLRVQARFEES